MRQFSFFTRLLIVMLVGVPADVHARHYDARTGRFLSVDPHANKYAAWSPYAYTFDNPLKYVDPDGKEVRLGSRLDRVLSFFGYKTENLRYVERAADILKQTETGRKLYGELDARKEVFNVQVSTLGRTNEGIILGKTAPEQKDGKFDGATIELDPENIQTKVDIVGGNAEDESAITLGHEFGHAKAAADNLEQYKKDHKEGMSEQRQALPFEEKVRNELEQIREKEDKAQ